MANPVDIVSDVPVQDGQLAATLVPDDGTAEPYVELNSHGIDLTAWVSLAMLGLIAIFLWKKVPALIAGGLDKKIDEIRTQLDEAKSLREEAEALRNEYSAKIANAEVDAQAMLEHARKEAGQIVSKAEEDSALMIVRRQKMAEDKIAAAERGAIEELRIRAITAATGAAHQLIAEQHNAGADTQLVNEAISEI